MEVIAEILLSGKEEKNPRSGNQERGVLRKVPHQWRVRRSGALKKTTEMHQTLRNQYAYRIAWRC